MSNTRTAIVCTGTGGRGQLSGKCNAACCEEGGSRTTGSKEKLTLLYRP